MAGISERELRKMDRERKKLEEERRKIMEDIARQREEYVQTRAQRRVIVNAPDEIDQDRRGIEPTYQELSTADLNLTGMPMSASSKDNLRFTSQHTEDDEFDLATAMQAYGREDSLLTVDENYSDSEEEVFEKLLTKSKDTERLNPSVIKETELEKRRDQVEREINIPGVPESKSEDTVPMKVQQPLLHEPAFQQPKEAVLTNDMKASHSLSYTDLYQLRLIDKEDSMAFRRESLKEREATGAKYGGNPQRRERERVARQLFKSEMESPYDIEFGIEDIESQERAMEERIKSLLLQDKKLDEQRKLREFAEHELNEKFKLIQFRERKITEEMQKRQRIVDMKTEEQRLERSLKQKIKEDKEREQRMQILYSQQMKLEEEVRKKEEMLLPSPYYMSRTEVGKSARDQKPNASCLADELLLKEEELRLKDEKILFLSKQLEHQQLQPQHSDDQPQQQQQPAAKPDSKDEELKRKEEYLKKLEEDLNRKEDEIRSKIQAGATIQPSADEAVKKSDITHFIKPYISQFSGTEPLPKNESTFETWKLEIQCLMKTYPDYLVAQAIRNSLKGPARKALIAIKPSAKAPELLTKLENVFGNVASGESVLHEFYTASQRSDESVTMWGLRLEEIVQKAIEKGHITESQKNEMLRTKFWRALYSVELKNATRVYFEQIKEFELLRRKVRAEEYEMSTTKTVSDKETVKESKIKSTEKGQETTIKGIQHQPIQIDPTMKMMQDLTKRLERIEKAVSYRRYNRWTKNSDQTGKNQSQNQQSAQSKTDPKTTEKKDINSSKSLNQ